MLLVVVGAAVAGGGGGDGGEAVADPEPPAETPAPRGSAATVAVVPVGPEPAWIRGSIAALVLTSPAHADEVISTQELVVSGHLRESSWHVRVVLKSPDGKPIEVRTGGPMTLPGDRDRSPGRRFEVPLPLSAPRPSGPAVVQVVAYDTSGRARGIVSRSIQIGLFRGPASSAETERMARCHLPAAIRPQWRIELAAPGC